MEVETKRGESLRERVDHQLGVSLDTEVKTREIARYLANELLPSEDEAKVEPEKPTPEPQGWFEEILHVLNKLRQSQGATAHDLARLREAMITGLVKKASK